MGSPTFGMPGTSNNAPPPPMGNTNPTGTNNGVGFNSGGSTFPNYPAFGTPSSGPVSPSANSGIFGGGSGSGLANLFQNPLADYYSNTSFWNQVGKAYGPGVGQALQTEFGQLFDPQTVAAFLDAQQPGINQGLASVQDSFGAEGSRFGSAASLGIGNYESQVQLNQQQTIASMYENAVGQELNMTSSMMPTLHQEKADSGWMHDFSDFFNVAMSVGELVQGPLPTQAPTNLLQGSTGNPGSGPAVAGTTGGGSTPTSGSGSSIGDMSDSGIGGLEDYSQSTSAASALGGASGLLGDTSAAGGIGSLSELAAFF